MCAMLGLVTPSWNWYPIRWGTGESGNKSPDNDKTDKASGSRKGCDSDGEVTVVKLENKVRGLASCTVELLEHPNELTSGCLKF